MSLTEQAARCRQHRGSAEQGGWGWGWGEAGRTVKSRGTQVACCSSRTVSRAEQRRNCRCYYYNLREIWLGRDLTPSHCELLDCQPPRAAHNATCQLVCLGKQVCVLVTVAWAVFIISVLRLASDPCSRALDTKRAAALVAMMAK